MTSPLTTRAVVPAPVQRSTSHAASALPVAAFVLDAALLTVVGFAAVQGRARVDLMFAPSVNVESQAAMAGPMMVAGWLIMLIASGGYRSGLFGAGPDEYKRVVSTGLTTAGLTGIACYLLKFQLSRGYFLLFFALAVPALLIGRFLLRRVLHAARRRGSFGRRVVLAGSRAHVDEVAAILSRESWLGYQVVGALTPEYDVSECTPSGIPVLGNSSDDVAASLAGADADTIVFAGGASGSSSHLKRVFWELEQENIQVIVAPSVTDVSSERLAVRPVGGLPLIHVEPARWSGALRGGKRAFDLVVASCLLLVLWPLMLLVGIVVATHDRGPVLFRQPRVGRDGQVFDCLKFRTMVVDAEAGLEQLRRESGHHEGAFKLRQDPRVTAPGRLIRRLSLDELPQLVNVLRGEMSLVGPRPPLPLEVARYDDAAVRRLRVRPGMTGLWQISGRSDLSWSESLRLDVYYVDNWSMLQDLAILGRTVSAVISGRGAY